MPNDLPDSVPLREHLEALREADAAFANERDRLREKAVTIKEEADLKALTLAREIQTYKDEKANELRSQIDRERGTYATQSDLRAAVDRLEAVIKPLAEYVAGQTGKVQGVRMTTGVGVTILTLVLMLMGGILGAITFATRN